MEKTRIVFLYSELATYFLACIDELHKRENIEVHIIRWEVNKEAPFHFTFSENIHIYNRKDYSTYEELSKFVSSLSPSIIYCSGWLDKGYLKVCKEYKSRIPVIVGFDNQWTGSLRQHVATWLSPFKLLNHFSHCWVPGILQFEFAKRLGFKNQNILSGFYCCDYHLFHGQFLKNKNAKEQNFPKRFLYVGRYTEFKGIKILWQAFSELQNENPNDWELWCLGAGDLEPVQHPKIKHFGFVQPSQLNEYIKNTGVFVLPSFFEPWGVVIHEFAAAGFPIICSNEVGSRLSFVENNYNGYIYKSSELLELKAALKKMMNLNSLELCQMAERSVEKASKITPQSWSQTLLSLIKK